MRAITSTKYRRRADRSTGFLGEIEDALTEIQLADHSENLFFAQAHAGGKAAAEVFPLEQPGYKQVTRFLAMIARDYAKAKHWRYTGRIDKALRMERAIDEMIEVMFSHVEALPEQRQSNPRGRSAPELPAKGYINRRSQISDKPPTKRLRARRAAALEQGNSGYFPNPRGRSAPQLPAKGYINRRSQISDKPPTKRLRARRAAALKQGNSGYFPNPVGYSGRALEAYQEGLRQGYNSASWQDLPEIGAEIWTESDGRITVDESNQWDIVQSLAFDAESNSRQYSPFEELASAFNRSRNADALWGAYDAGVADGIAKNIAERQRPASTRKVGRYTNPRGTVAVTRNESRTYPTLPEAKQAAQKIADRINAPVFIEQVHQGWHVHYAKRKGK